jgi:hypothetical protein
VVIDGQEFPKYVIGDYGNIEIDLTSF